MFTPSEKLIQSTIEEWSPHAGYALSRDDAIEIIENTTNLFRLLIELDQKFGDKTTDSCEIQR